ncbi:hypothetical protein [Methyloligella solikamskensis]|uniref:Uncharacterized protein n=1 Tax=Methyloligella solikamskensis TaxID=1177756 RepID=A0ABW3J9K0_9HYPH
MTSKRNFALAGGLLILAAMTPALVQAAEPRVEYQGEWADDRDPNIYGNEPGDEVPAYRGGDMYEGADLDTPGSSEVEGGYGN